MEGGLAESRLDAIERLVAVECRTGPFRQLADLDQLFSLGKRLGLESGNVNFLIALLLLAVRTFGQFASEI